MYSYLVSRENEKVLLPLFFTMAYNTVLVGEANCFNDF